jgi:hypothetical protein
MEKDGKILLVETDEQACGQLADVLSGLHMANETVCFSNAETASEYLSKNYNDIFMVLQNVASPGLQLPDSRNMIYMHEKFNIAEVAYVFLIHPNAPKEKTHTFVHCYYRTAPAINLKKVFAELITYWKAQIFNHDQVRMGFGNG